MSTQAWALAHRSQAHPDQSRVALAAYHCPATMETKEYITTLN